MPTPGSTSRDFSISSEHSNQNWNTSALEYNRMLPLEKLEAIAEQHGEAYQNATPFAHAVFDDVFDPELLDRIIEEFSLCDGGWKEFSTKYERKLQMTRDRNLGPVTRAFIHNLNSEPFLYFLQNLTGIRGLLPDPYLAGGGLHRIPPGGKLGIHVDFNEHKALNLIRRLNVLLYLNRDWREEYGGHFELWDEHRQGAQKCILPIFNRMAIFTTTSTSFHGHPQPLACPKDRSRISLALYYYTAAERGEQSRKSHGTVFLTPDGRRDELGKENLLLRVRRKAGRLVKGAFSAG